MRSFIVILSESMNISLVDSCDELQSQYVVEGLSLCTSVDVLVTEFLHVGRSRISTLRPLCVLDHLKSDVSCNKHAGVVSLLEI